MLPKVILASSSEARSTLLKNAGIQHQLVAAVIDEETVKSALELERRSPRDVADILADMKARKIAIRFPEIFTIGCDQVLVFDKKLYSKPKTKRDMILQLDTMQGKSHELVSAAVIYQGNLPIWRYIATTEVTLRNLSPKFIESYVEDHWEVTKNCVGGYQIESSGLKIVKKIRGDFFNILGIPLLEVVDFLEINGVLNN